MSQSAPAEEYKWVHPSVLDELKADGRVHKLNSTPIVSSFNKAITTLCDRPSTVIVPKDCIDTLDDYGLRPARLALRRGSLRRLRDSNPRYSLQLWEYQTYYLVKLNRFNPEEGRLLEHALTDKLSYTLCASALAGAAYLWWKSD